MIKVIGTEQAAPTTTGAGTNLSNATMIRCYNSGGTDRLITIQLADNTAIGTFTLKTKEVEYVDKATMVRVFNGHSGDVLVTVQQADNTLIGTFTLVTKGVEYVKKDSLHEMFAGNAAVKFANVQVLG